MQSLARRFRSRSPEASWTGGQRLDQLLRDHCRSPRRNLRQSLQKARLSGNRPLFSIVLWRGPLQQPKGVRPVKLGQMLGKSRRQSTSHEQSITNPCLAQPWSKASLPSCRASSSKGCGDRHPRSCRPNCLVMVINEAELCLAFCVTAAGVQVVTQGERS